MPVDEYVAEGIRRGDDGAVSLAEHHSTLLAEDFWDKFFAEAVRSDPIRERAEHLMHSGTVTKSTTIANSWSMAKEQ